MRARRVRGAVFADGDDSLLFTAGATGSSGYCVFGAAPTQLRSSSGTLEERLVFTATGWVGEVQFVTTQPSANKLLALSAGNKNGCRAHAPLTARALASTRRCTLLTVIARARGARASYRGGIPIRLRYGGPSPFE